MASPLRLLAIATLVATPGCLEADPNHCANKEGHQSCDSATPFCSICAKSSNNGGCVKAEDLEEGCRYQGGEDIAATDPTDPTGMTMSMTEPGSDDPSMTADATMDSADDVITGGDCGECPPEQPYCIDGACSTCTDTPDVCPGATPVCGPLGVCVECSAQQMAACADDEFCSPAGTCGGCTSHDQCAPAGCVDDECGACDLFSGKCLAAVVFWVDNTNPNCSAQEMGDGSPENPYCDFDTALMNQAGFSQFTLRVRATGQPYDPIGITSTAMENRIAIVGYDGRPRVLGSNQALFITSSMNRLIASHLELDDGTSAVARCTTGGRLYLDDVLVHGGPVGVDANNCTVIRVRDSIIIENGLGLAAHNTNLSVANTVIANNGSANTSNNGGVRITQTDPWEITYSTLVANANMGAGSSLRCTDDSPGAVRNSIVLGEGDTVDCSTGVFSYSATDEEDLAGGTGIMVTVYAGTDFQNPGNRDYHLRRDGVNKFADVARWLPTDPPIDIDGDLRPILPDAPGWPGFDHP